MLLYNAKFQFLFFCFPHLRHIRPTVEIIVILDSMYGIRYFSYSTRWSFLSLQLLYRLFRICECLKLQMGGIWSMCLNIQPCVSLWGCRTHPVQYFAFSFEAEGIQHLRGGITLRTEQWVIYILYSSTPMLFRVLPCLKDSPACV